MPRCERITPLLTADAIQRRVGELGDEITRAYQGREPVLIGVLKGCFLFMADLCRRIDLNLSVDFLGLSSYGGDTKSTGVVKITKDLSSPITGKEVLVIEDIIDTGLTMRYLLRNLATRGPSGIKVCTLLKKPLAANDELRIDFLGFEIPNRFVVGYGLDYTGLYRNLPFIGVLEE